MVDIQILSRFAACDGNRTDASCTKNGQEALELLGLKEVGKTSYIILVTLLPHLSLSLSVTC